MCKEMVNVSEVQLALRQMEDLVRHVNTYVSSWGEFVGNRGLRELQSDFLEAEELAVQLRKKLHQLQHKLQDQQEETAGITVTDMRR